MAGEGLDWSRALVSLNLKSLLVSFEEVTCLYCTVRRRGCVQDRLFLTLTYNPALPTSDMDCCDTRSSLTHLLSQLTK